jgi:hypothetical protein
MQRSIFSNVKKNSEQDEEEFKLAVENFKVEVVKELVDSGFKLTIEHLKFCKAYLSEFTDGACTSVPLIKLNNEIQKIIQNRLGVEENAPRIEPAENAPRLR